MTAPKLPQRVLLTGGAGFVGSNLARLVLERFPDVRLTVLDDTSTGFWRLLPQDARLVQVDGSVTDASLVDRLVADTDLVFHLAARNIIASTNNPLSDFEVNIGGTLNVLMAARRHGNKRVVYSSSASVYGNPRYLPIGEDDHVSTLTPYSVSKLAGENYCRAFYESYDLPTAVVRYSNVYGPGQDPRNPYCGVIGRFVRDAVEGKPLAVHGDGEQTRDFTYVEDAVEATLMAGISERGLGEVFNVATGVETSVNTLVSTIQRVGGGGSPIEHIERRDIDNIRRRVLNIDRIRRVLRWVPRYTLAAGLTQTVEWYKAEVRGQ